VNDIPGCGGPVRPDWFDLCWLGLGVAVVAGMIVVLWSMRGKDGGGAA
jgi:hypothetical protein